MVRGISRHSIYWALRAIAEKNDALCRLFEEVCQRYALRKDPLLKFMLSKVALGKVAPGSVIYDIGASIGQYSILLAQKVENSLIYSFEPNPHSYATLVNNVRLMKLEGRVIPKNVALSKDIGKRTFYVSSYEARSSFHEPNAKYGGNKIISTSIIDFYNIDSLVESEFCKPPNVMKIDVEGHEYEVLYGAKHTIASKLPQIFLELHGRDDVTSYRDRILDFLDTFGYAHKSIRKNYFRFYKEG